VSDIEFDTPLDKLLYAQRQAIVFSAPIGSMLSKLRFREEPALTTTMKALPNGCYLYNPEYVDVTPIDHLVSLMTHAVFHAGLREGMCNQYWDPAKYRIGIEAKITQCIEDACLPQIMGTERVVEWDESAVEDIIDQIPETSVEAAIEACPLKLPLDIGADSEEDPDGGGDDNSDTRPALMTSALHDAAQIAKDMGREFLGLKLLIGNVMAPQIDWRTKLRYAVTQVPGLWGRSFRKPSRRSPGIAMGSGTPGYILPGPSSGYESVVLVIDLSGSVVGDRGLVEDFLAEMNGIIKLCQRPCRVIMHEYDVTQDFQTKTLDKIVEMLIGGGGTSFVPVYELLAQAQEKIPLVVWLTDLYGDHVPTEPPFPVIWVAGQNHDTAPWGTIIELPDQDSSRRDPYESDSEF
jgi:predicted metal-dependent peptidase